jgi:hypothetical protein
MRGCRQTSRRQPEQDDRQHRMCAVLESLTAHATLRSVADRVHQWLSTGQVTNYTLCLAAFRLSHSVCRAMARAYTHTLALSRPLPRLFLDFISPENVHSLSRLSSSANYLYGFGAIYL